MPRKRGLRRSLQERKVEYLLVQGDIRETTTVLEDVRLIMPERNMYDTVPESRNKYSGAINNGGRIYIYNYHMDRGGLGRVGR